MKKFVSVLLTLLMLASVFLPVTVFAEERSAKIENPFYSGGSVAQPLGAKKALIEDSVTDTYGGKTYYTLGRQLYNIVKKKLDARENDVTVHYLSKSELFSRYAATTKVLNQIFIGATEDELSVSCTDGDYVRWAVSALDTVDMKKEVKQNGYYHYTLDFEFDYYDTPAEEEQVDKAVDKFLAAIKPNGKSDYEIIKAVHDRLCNMNVYEYAAVDDTYGHQYAFTAYGALVKGRCVCQGYAAAFYRICKELGYDVRFVSSNPMLGCHAWNLINLDGKYYFVDCTWDDQAMDENLEQITPYTYFLVTYGNSREYDSSLGEHKLDSTYYDNRYFDEKFTANFAQENYDKTASGKLSNCRVTLAADTYTYDGKAKQPAVTVKTLSGTALTAGTDYTVTYGDNTATGEGSVTIKGSGDYKGRKAKRHITIVPKTTENVKITSAGATSLKMSWRKAGGAVSGYEVQRYVNGKWVSYLNTDTHINTLSGLQEATEYRLRVRTYTLIGRRTVYSAFGKEVMIYTKPKRGEITELSAGKKAFTVRWSEADCTGYEIQYAKNKDMSGAKSMYIKDGRLSKTVSKLKKGTRYYLRVRSFIKYKDLSGKTVKRYGAWSAIKGVNVKA